MNDEDGRAGAARPIDGLADADADADMNGNGFRTRLRFIESLARRTAAAEGETARLLEARLATLNAEITSIRPAQVAPVAADHVAMPAVQGGPLAELVAHIARQAPSPPVRSTAAPTGGSIAAPIAASIDPATLHFFRRTWARLGADQRYAQSLSTLPDNAGPLHSHQLVHRALSAMRDLSPAYFERFGSYLDALFWIESANAAREPTPVARRVVGGKTARGKRP